MILIRVQGVELDRAARRVRVRDQLFNLPRKEFELLEFLMLNAGIGQTRQKLLARLWGDPFHGDEKTLDVHIRRRRRKVEVDPHHPTLIRTIRGYGYIVDQEPAEG